MAQPEQRRAVRKLRRIRAEKGLTMDALEERTGVSKRTISEIERGMRTPQTLTLAKLANALDVDLEELLEEASPKAQASPHLDLEEPAGPAESGDEPTHITIVIDKIGGARSIAQEVAHEWRRDAERSLEENRPLTKHRTLEMRSLHNELSRIYIDSIRSIQRGAQQGITGILREGVEQVITADPGLWPRELREFVYEAGASIAVLPEVISTIEKELATEQLQAAAKRALYEEFNVEDHFPTELFLEEDWREAVDKASSRAKA